jgi:hypothetical protein
MHKVFLWVFLLCVCTSYNSYAAPNLTPISPLPIHSLPPVINNPPTKTSIKLPIYGLVSMGSLEVLTGPASSSNSASTTEVTFPEINYRPGYFSAGVILVTWAQLEPTQGKFNFSLIDTALANIAAYNKKYPATPITGKLRVIAGFNSPAFVLALDGGALTLEHKGGNVIVPRWWTSDYHSAWLGLVNALAAKYDNRPLMQEVAVTSCSSVSAEPMVTPLDAVNIPILKAAGYTDALGEACLTNAVTDYVAWTHTSIDFTFNPWRDIDSGVDVWNHKFPPQLMTAFRAEYPHGVLANHGLQTSIGKQETLVYGMFNTLGKPVEFQTGGVSGMNFDTAYQNGISHNMTEFELWDEKPAGGAASYSTQELTTWKNGLAKPTTTP